jgi:tripartite-type tricarboxylate transporter receptor subunit TctC
MVRALVILTMLVLAARPDAYAQDFPTRPITILIGLAAGGVSDTMARLYADAVSKTLGQRVIVENRATGSGAMAAAALQNAQPDGHTLLIFSGAQHGVVPAIDKTGIYDPIKGNQPITLLFNTANVLAVPAASPVNSVGAGRVRKEKGRRPDFRIPRRRLALASHRRQDHRRDRDAGSGGALPGRSADDG